MPELVSSNTPASVGGTGAVFFDKTIDPLTLQLHLNDMLQQGRQERQVDQQEFLKNTQALQSSLQVPNQTGAWSGDMDFLTKKAQELQQAGVNTIKSGSSLNSLEYQNLKSAYMGYLNKSIQTQKWATENTTAALADKGDKFDLEATNANIAAQLALPLDKRGALSGTALIPIKANADATTEKFVNTFPNQKTKIATQEGGFEVTKETEQRTGVGMPGTPQFQQSVMGLAYGSDTKQSMQAGYSSLPLTAKNDYIKQAVSKGADVNGAPDKAYELYVADKIMQRNIINRTTDVHGETEAAKVAAKKAGASADQIGIANEMAGAWVRDPSVMSSTIYTSPVKEGVNGGKPTQSPLIGTTMLNSAIELNKFHVREDGVDKDIDNHITFFGYDPKSGRRLLASVETEYNYAKGLSDSPFYSPSSFRELASYIGNRIPKSTKEEGLDPLSGLTAFLGSKDIGWDAEKVNPLSAEAKAQRNKTEGVVPATGTYNPVGVAPNAKLPTQGTKTAMGNYKIGEVQGGYKYTGGDPTKQENWEKQ